MSAVPASLGWFVRHEATLAWRDGLAMMTGGRPVRAAILAAVVIAFAGGLHLLALALIGPWAHAGIVADKPTLVLLTGTGLLFTTVMMSQALESVTRAYYARADLDLILSSPASSRRLFAVRTGAIALTTVALSCLLASPVIDTLIIADGPRWIAAYGVLAALGALAAAGSVLVTIGLFRIIGPKRTRLVAQIIAGVIGAGFLIGIQVAAILGLGSMSRFELLQSDDLIAAAPALDALLYLPARAAMGDLAALAVVTTVGFGALATVIAATSSGFAFHAIAAAGVSRGATHHRARSAPFRRATQRQALRRKEWKLLARDPWLLSQTLMQVLYLLPPALLLWLNYQDAGIFVVVAPVIVMASGQLAGGLAWLAISGEDAHDLVVTAPLSARDILIAKIEAVIGAIAVVLAPILLLVALSSVSTAVIIAAVAALASGSATAIQMWFRAQARRSLFRRRQVSSRIATIAEALVSIMWAGVAALLVSGTAWLAAVPAALALVVLAAARALRPRSVP